MRPLHSFPLMLLIIFYHSLPLTSGASVHKMASAVHKMAASVSPVQPIQRSIRQGKMLGKCDVFFFTYFFNKTTTL